MRPKLIVCIGRFFSEQRNETDSFEKFKGYLDKFGAIVRDKELHNLREMTEWIFIPAIDDPGQIRAMPSAPMSEYLLEGFMGKHLSSTTAKIKKVTLGCNPLRISFMGQEIVIARYNFLKKMQQNGFSKINFVQKQWLGQNPDHQPVADTYKVSNTILKQGFLLPLPQIVQPVLWNYAVDCLNLTPEPDILVLADECQDFHHKFETEDFSEDVPTSRSCHVLNPGNFANDHSFVVLYPLRPDEDKVESSKIDTSLKL